MVVGVDGGQWRGKREHGVVRLSDAGVWAARLTAGRTRTCSCRLPGPLRPHIAAREREHRARLFMTHWLAGRLKYSRIPGV